MPKLLSLTIGWFLKFTEYVGFPSLEILKESCNFFEGDKML